MSWDDQPAIVIASGPSLTLDDIALVEKAKLFTVAVNSTWEKVRFCDVIYAGDQAWWRHNQAKIDIPAQRWTCSRAAATLYGGHYRNRKVIPGYNSGANAVELVANVFRATPVLMLGFDCSLKHGVHHHGLHERTGNPTPERVERWKLQFNSLQTKTANTEIINCSRYTEIENFPKRDLDEVLCELGLI